MSSWGLVWTVPPSLVLRNVVWYNQHGLLDLIMYHDSNAMARLRSCWMIPWNIVLGVMGFWHNVMHRRPPTPGHDFEDSASMPGMPAWMSWKENFCCIPIPCYVLWRDGVTQSGHFCQGMKMLMHIAGVISVGSEITPTQPTANRTNS